VVLIAINSMLRQRRRFLGLAVVTLALSAAAVTAQGASAGSHLGSMAGGHVMSEGAHAAVTMCLAIVETAALALGAVVVAWALRGPHGRLQPIVWPVASRRHPSVAAPDRRARPPDLALLQVFRR